MTRRKHAEKMASDASYWACTVLVLLPSSLAAAAGFRARPRSRRTTSHGRPGDRAPRTASPDAVAADITDALRQRVAATKGYQLLQGKDLVEVKLVFACPDEAPACMSQAGKEPGGVEAHLRQRQEGRERLPGHPEAAGREPRGRRELHGRDRRRRSTPTPTGLRSAGARLARQAERQGRRVDPGAGELPGRGRQPRWNAGGHDRDAAPSSSPTSRPAATRSPSRRAATPRPSRSSRWPPGRACRSA